MNKMKNVKRTIIDESNLGLYVWVINGKMVGDDQGNYLSVPSEKGDVKKITALRNYVYGFLKDMQLEPQGQAVFLSGRRQITDDEYEEQVARQKWGLIADPYDVPAMEEELKHRGTFGQ